MIKIYDFEQINLDAILTRDISNNNDVEIVVTDIIENVKKNKDKALFEYSKKFDKVNLESLVVSKDEIKNALKRVNPEFIKILKKAKSNIENFHKKQIRNDFVVCENEGIVMGQKITPIEKVGIYVPGGTAFYPSSILMNAIPAKIAGVDEIIMVSPPNKEGTLCDEVLAAAEIAGVDKIVKVGGAQSIAALAYGTESVQKVDKIVGPGNIFVATAKKMVYGLVDIDMIAGPSEILVIADETCNYKFVSADLLSQAEHDKLASAILITNSKKLALQVQKELEYQMSKLNRGEIAKASIDNYGKIIIVDSIDKAIEISNEIAPEHLEICVDNPFEYLSKVKNAGSIFLGKYTPEALGDYFAGPNHVLPTNGTAKFSSPLSVDEFIKKSSYLYYSKDALKNVSKDVSYFANVEGLDAHANSIDIRFKEEV